MSEKDELLEKNRKLVEAGVSEVSNNSKKVKKFKRCPDCIRPVCQRILTLRGCKEKPIEEIKGVPMNPYSMHDLFTTG